MSLERILYENWDYIIIGTGISGATLGYDLVRKNKKVLFIEKGGLLSQADGQFPDLKAKNYTQISEMYRAQLYQNKRETSVIIDRSHPKGIPFVPLLGSGVGGSSVLYGAAFERFFPLDFNPTKYFGHLQDASVVDWPIQYDDLAPFYTQAEALYKVYGGVDPLREPFQNKNLLKAELTEQGEKLWQKFKTQNLNPYRLPVAHKPLSASKCTGCQAVVCSCNDKMDSFQACIKKAIEYPNCMVLTDTQVEKICGDQRVQSILVHYKGKELSLKAKTFILAAGALHSPALLLRSANPNWIKGFANRSGLIGRNLCRHYMDLYITNINPFKKSSTFEKELALNDFYFVNQLKLGTLQSLGRPPSFETVLFEMYNEFYNRSFGSKMYYKWVEIFGGNFISFLFNHSISFASIMEDVPYTENQVFLGTNGSININYQIRSEGHSRIEHFRKLIKENFKTHLSLLHKQAENNQRLAHASGTCRMGEDPNQSVVNKWNRCHDVENLYIVDASYFPSSAGMNPSLTLAANALRVANHLS